MKKRLIGLLLLQSIFTFAQNESNDSIILSFDSIEENYDPIEIKEVLIKGQKKRLFSDKAIYTFDKSAIDRAKYAKDLLATLPELQYDFVNNTIQSTKGGITLFLINGIEATDLQIRSIKPTNVLRVEYFDIPPARWSNRANQVVNIITSNPENGYVYGIDSNSAFKTGFVNASAYANLTRGKNDFGFEYNFNLRDYNNRENNSVYTYTLNNQQYTSDLKQFDHFGYTYQNILLRYTNNSEKYTFQAKGLVEILSTFSHANGNNLFTINQLINSHTTKGHTNSNYVKPSVDLYYSRKLSKKDEFILNFIGTQYETNSYESSQEWITSAGTSVFNNQMNLKAKQTNLIGEIAYRYLFDKNSLNVGYRFSSNQINNHLINLLGDNNYKVNYLQHYFYSEFSGKNKKLMYSIGAGLTNINNNSAESVQNEWTITPKLVIGYELNKNQSLRFTSSYQPLSPWSEALSSNVIQMVPNIVRRGNPYLTPQKQFNNNLIYSFQSKYFDLNTSVRFNLTKDAIYQSFIYDQLLKGYALSYENANYFLNYALQVTGSIKPFGNELLNIKVNVSPTKEKVKDSKGSILDNDYIASSFVVSSVYKDFSLYYMVNIPTYSLNGAFLNTIENSNHLFLKYTKNDLSLTLGMYWMGMPSEYKSNTLDTSLVNLNSHTQIWNNKNMFTLGLSYDFATGKRNSIDRKLNNSTAPAATF